MFWFGHKTIFGVVEVVVITNQKISCFYFFKISNSISPISQNVPEKPFGHIHPWKVPFENVVQVPEFLQGEELQAFTFSKKIDTLLY
jgi:hypothetical protein